MELRHKSVFGGLLIAFLVAVLPGRAQTNCASNQGAAVECFVGNAVKTQLATVPAGMTLAEYEAYGVAVSRILQTHHTYPVVDERFCNEFGAALPHGADTGRPRTIRRDFGAGPKSDAGGSKLEAGKAPLSHKGWLGGKISAVSSQQSAVYFHR